MKYLTTVLVILALCIGIYSIVLINKNKQLEIESIEAHQNSTVTKAKLVLRLDSLQDKFDSLKQVKRQKLIVYHDKIVEIKKTITVDSTQYVIFTPEYQLLSLQYDSLSTDNYYLTKQYENIILQLNSTTKFVDSIMYDKYKHIIYRLYWK